MVLDLRLEEQKKYEKVWSYQFYRRQADGDPVVETAFKDMGCKPGETLIDWGCGKGTPAAKLAAMGLKVTGFDIAKNCLDPNVRVNFIVGCLWDADLPVELTADYAFCTDVLEHVPTEHLPAALDNIRARTSKAAFIQVCTAHDTSGRKMDPPMQLHLSVFPHDWWYGSLRTRWGKVEGSWRGKSRSYFLCLR